MLELDDPEANSDADSDEIDYLAAANVNVYKPKNDDQKTQAYNQNEEQKEEESDDDDEELSSVRIILNNDLSQEPASVPSVTLLA